MASRTKKKAATKADTKIVIGAHVSASVRDRLKEHADADNRSVSNLIQIILTEWLDSAEE